VSLLWKLRRVSAMSGPELGYRLRQQLQAAYERLGFNAPRPRRFDAAAAGKAWVDPLPRAFDVDKYRAAADEILAGRFRIFALRPAQLGFPPRWNRDPKTGRDAPLVHGKTLNYRDAAVVGDIKYLWEPSRHAQLVTLAQAWYLSGEAKYAAGCRQLLESWLEQCPRPLGPHWTSSLELALRLVNWSFAWHLLGGEHSVLFQGEDGQTFRRRWLASVHEHSHFIAGHLSRHSSANNHLLGELTGLFIAAVTWPFWSQSAGWRRRARTELEREALLQTASDGVNKEQANWYHHEVADMMLLTALVARANGESFGSDYLTRLRAMLEYLASIMDVGGNVPNFGDADDAVIAPLDPAADAAVYRSLLASGAVLFECGEFKRKAGLFDDKSRWLLGDAAQLRFAEIDARNVQLPMRRSFEERGYYVLGERFETRGEVRIVADAGPLGYLAIAAHGHADALSFTLSAGGCEMLIDPGTYAYHTQKSWRDYFRGTAAHNTVRVDHRDQSQNAGNFLWLRHATAKVISWERSAQEERWLAEHDGYRRLPDPVLHRRELCWSRPGSTLIVADQLSCRGSHQVELFWHFAEGCAVERVDGGLLVRNGPVTLSIALPAQMSWELQRGRESPPAGWISRSFDTRVPTVTAIGLAPIRGTSRFVTQIRVSVAEDLSGRRPASGRSAAPAPSCAAG
jgi:hypothetical protein